MEFTEDQIAQLEQDSRRRKKKDDGEKEGEPVTYHEEDPNELDFEDYA
ncbi:MAG: hypothetical protein GY829_08600 [Gammaproteobacteria bacterium]|nr:hypothetical protein [Gammaproteobacteria bacterium]